MSFYYEYEKVKDFSFHDYFTNITIQDVKQVLHKNVLTTEDFLILLSPAAENCLEEMAHKAHQLTVQYFGKTIQIYAPLYLTDHCVNKCTYCSFSIDNDFPRRKLSIPEIEEESKALVKMGLRHIILLTGESRIHSSVEYLCDTIEVMKKYFSSLSIEIQPIDTSEYKTLVAHGIDGLTVYQEVYNEEIYKQHHLKGPKRNYRYRLDAPERGCQAGMKSVNIGALLGMDDWRKEVFFTGLHARYLQKKYLHTDIALSFPRIRPNLGGFQPKVNVTDKNLVQAMLAARLLLPRAGMTLSTRESAELRRHLLPLGVTKMSAASSTVVGGYANKDHSHSQFEISDKRSVAEVKASLREQGYQPVVKDWEMLAQS